MRVTLPKPQPLLFFIFCGFEIIDQLILSDDDGDNIGATNDNDATMMTMIMVIQMLM